MRNLKSKFVCDIGPSGHNPRNSEGAFVRNVDGSILFAYSRYSGNDWNDHQPSDIALIRSYDEGNTWTEPEIIVTADKFGTSNIMSVSSIIQNDGSVGFYFIVKKFIDENPEEGTGLYSTIGRALSCDGINFQVEECKMNCPDGYYIFHNDRMVRLSDGRLVFPSSPAVEHTECAVTVFVSDDDGKTFTATEPWIYMDKGLKSPRGLQEPGIIEHNDGSIRIWARTDRSYQYEFYSYDGLKTFTTPYPSEFTSPLAPMSMKRSCDGALYTVYNPIPLYNGREESYSHVTIGGRNPLIIRKSVDDGKTWGACNIVEADENRGLCYSAMFFTSDDSLLLAYCRGGEEDVCGLNRLGIKKISLIDIE